MPVRGRSILALILGGSLAACVTDHAALEKMSRAAGGAGGSLGGSGGVAGHPTVIGGGAGGAGAVGGHPDHEAPGTSVLTFVHGVVDAPRVALCFAQVAADGTVVPFGKPLGAAPLEYGATLVLPSISGADFSSDTLEPFLIAGDLKLIAGLTCAAAIDRSNAEEDAVASATLGSSPTGAGGDSAGGAAGESAAGQSAAGAAGSAPVEVQSRLRARGLPAIPAGTLSAGRSMLLVATGCMGGSGYDAPNSDQYCGAGYGEHSPNLSAMLVALSRATAVGHVGMQVLHASAATGVVDVRSQAASSATDPIAPIVINDGAGQLLPRPALLTHSAFDYGSARGNQIEVLAQGASLLSNDWADVLTRGGLDALVDGSTYALVLIGPRADLSGQTAFWNGPEITVVAAAPK